MSSPAPTTTTSPAAPAAATANTVAKNPKAIYVLMNFASLLVVQLIALALAVIKGLTDNPSFSNPPVDIPTFAITVSQLQTADTNARDGGKNARAVRDNLQKLVCQHLKLLAVYVENNCNNDPAAFSTTGFVAKAASRTVPSEVKVPWVKSLRHGPFSGQILVGIKAVDGAKSYNLRYAAMNATTPGAWTTIPVALLNRKVTVSNLIPGTVYGFEVQALGAQGYTDFSVTETLMSM